MIELNKEEKRIWKDLERYKIPHSSTILQIFLKYHTKINELEKEVIDLSDELTNLSELVNEGNL